MTKCIANVPKNIVSFKPRVVGTMGRDGSVPTVKISEKGRP